MIIITNNHYNNYYYNDCQSFVNALCTYKDSVKLIDV